MWEYDAATLASDLSAQLLYGATTAAVFNIASALTGQGRFKMHGVNPMRADIQPGAAFSRL
jgi:hypothetical protein